MSLDSVFGQVPDPSSYSFPDYALPQGEPVRPVAVTEAELDSLLDLYERFAAVDPTGIDSNPFLRATSDFLEQTFGTTLERPDERLHDDIATLLSDFAEDLGDDSLGVVDVTSAHFRTLYFFLTSCKAYHVAPHIQFSPDEDAVETLYELYRRVVDQEFYLKRPRSVLE
ncbi:hypothetical protein [Haloarcula salinisoli]|uniref:Uncharacterized protein n=1 Tax=Haloarcula salinisoli TaxID=2487746 RepID=A0A8J7YL94_9EURY|nr:hypothetical protein [Halomicroarcula salinisoli]MBX0288239.1 hypothetical protein [Halomicroarcula salinisoli]MBX0305401.1 hypothetical protein [Halomicroarcula salinisoli]